MSLLLDPLVIRSLFLRCLLLFLLLFLSSCGSGCIHSEDEINGSAKEKSLLICANPLEKSGKNDSICQKPAELSVNNPSTYWIESGFVGVGGEVGLSVEYAHNVSVCSGCPAICFDQKGNNLCDKDTCKLFELQYGQYDLPTLDMDFKTGDAISFSLLPYIEPSKITEDICDGKNKTVYPGDPNECRKKLLNRYYYSVIGNNDKPESNIVKRDDSWIDGNVLCSFATPDQLSNYGSNAEICDILKNKPQSSKALSIKNKFDIYTINQICGNLHTYSYDGDLNGILAQGSNYTSFAFIERSEYKLVLPLLYYPVIKFSDSDGNTIRQSILDQSIRQNASLPINDGFHGIFSLDKPTAIEECQEGTGCIYNKLTFTPIYPGVYLGKGGYRFKISKFCPADSGKILYAYVGSEAPDFKPGEGESFLIGPINVDADTRPLHKQSFTVESGKKLFFAIKDIRQNSYKENEGYFSIKLYIDGAKNTEKGIFAKIITGVRDQILRIMYGNNSVGSDGNMNQTFFDKPNGAVGSIYKAIINSWFLNTVKAMILLCIVVYSILFMIGSLRTPQLDFLVVILKIAFVAVLFGDNSWRFFNENLFNLFISGSSYLINVMSGTSFGNEETDFAFVDNLLGRFGKSFTWIQIFSLFFTGPIGWLFMFGIFWGSIEAFKAILNASVYYFMSIIVVAMLLCLSPLFISFLLFKRTKAIFDSWIKNLAQIAVIPSIIFASIALLSGAMVAVVHSVFNFAVCSKCVLEPSVDVLGIIYTFCVLKVYLPSLYDPDVSLFDRLSASTEGVDFLGLPVSFAALVAFIVMGHAISAFVSHASVIAVSIFGAPASSPESPASQFTDSMKSVVGADNQSIGRRAQAAYSKGLDKEKDPPKSKPR